LILHGACERVDGLAEAVVVAAEKPQAGQRRVGLIPCELGGGEEGAGCRAGVLLVGQRGAARSSNCGARPCGRRGGGGAAEGGPAALALGVSPGAIDAPILGEAARDLLLCGLEVPLSPLPVPLAESEVRPDRLLEHLSEAGGRRAGEEP